jgi:hypothetical protein
VDSSFKAPLLDGSDGTSPQACSGIGSEKADTGLPALTYDLQIALQFGVSDQPQMERKNPRPVPPVLRSACEGSCANHMRIFREGPACQRSTALREARERHWRVEILPVGDHTGR